MVDAIALEKNVRLVEAFLRKVAECPMDGDPLGSGEERLVTIQQAVAGYEVMVLNARSLVYELKRRKA